MSVISTEIGHIIHEIANKAALEVVIDLVKVNAQRGTYQTRPEDIKNTYDKAYENATQNWLRRLDTREK